MLNPALYEALRQLFGEVRITRPDMPMQADYVYYLDSATGQKRARLRTLPGMSGEEYLVCCPFCNDTRFRLSINHRWGVPDPTTRNRNLHLAICYNENCLQEGNNRLRLWHRVQAVMSCPARLQAVPVQSVKTVNPDEVRVVSFPGRVMGIADLKRSCPSHPAVRYLEQRGFCLEYLQRCFRVGVVLDSERPSYTGRIFVPVYWKAQLRGWQLRAADNVSQPRWYTMPGMPKSLLLYNADTALLQPVKILVEGASSAWSVGIQALACFGKSVSNHQLRHIADSMRENHRLILMLDPDPEPEPGREHHLVVAARKVASYESLRQSTYVVWLPKGKDPADFNRQELRRYIMASAEPIAKFL